METVKSDRANVKVDEKGFLIEQENWNEEVAQILAEREGIRLTEDKMDIIKFLRGYYQKHTNFPILNFVCKNLHKNRDCIAEEFIDPMKAWKIAGLPKPPNIFFANQYGKHYTPNPFF